MNKVEIRKTVKMRVKALTEPEKQMEAKRVFSAIEEMTCFEKASSILLYYSLPDELPSHAFVAAWAHHKQVFLQMETPYRRWYGEFASFYAV